jgi:hypothetical protein
MVSWLDGKMTLRSIFGKCSSPNVYEHFNEFSGMIYGVKWIDCIVVAVGLPLA